MSYITLKCKNCGSNMSLNTESHSATCIHCGSTFLLTDLLDEKDIEFTEKFSAKNLEQKMMAQGSLKQGETYLAQAEFEKAEECFKRAIELDENNFKPYLGIVKAKTKNLNSLPDDDDYIQYANYALSIAEGDDLVLVKSELAKLYLLKKEVGRQKKIKKNRQKQEEKYIANRQSESKLFSFVAICILIAFACFVFIGSGLFKSLFTNQNKTGSININSYETLKQVFSDEKYLSYNITLTSDIDCNNNEITPFGSKAKPFTGTFNGNKHKISNATINPSKNYDNVGLFGYTMLAKISNLVLDNISVLASESTISNSTNYIGLLVGKADATKISGIEATDSCIVQAVGTLDYNLSLGGLVGNLSNTSELNNVSSHSYLNVRLTQNSPTDIFIGSIAGSCTNSVVAKTCSNSESTVEISNTTPTFSNAYISGIVGYIQCNSTTDYNNTKNNFFSGDIKITSSGVLCNVSAIAKTNLKSTTKQNNYCLYTASSFTYNSTQVFSSITELSENSNFVEFCMSNGTYLSKLKTTFSSWKNSTTFTPSLV